MRMDKSFHPNFNPLPYFCANFLKHASKTKASEYSMACIFHFISGIGICHHQSLAMAHPYYTFRDHFICLGNGYCVESLMDFFTEKPSVGPKVFSFIYQIKAEQSEAQLRARSRVHIVTNGPHPDPHRRFLSK